jgi:alpha-ketoglutarate-dependent taurine dioxygenase
MSRIYAEFMSFRSEPIKPHIGEIVHVDRAGLADESVASRCLDLIETRCVLVFPRLRLSDEEQLAFTDRLGARGKRLRRNEAGEFVEIGEVYNVTFDAAFNTRPEYVLGTFFWHMDDMTSDYPPPKATLLTARRLSPKGGQTEFANTFAAYENLPAADKAEIAGLHAVHSLSASLRGVFDYQSREERERQDKLAVVKEHPLVWTRKSGRKSLVIGTTTDRIAGMPLAEGRALLERLREWTVQPDFVYRHEWQDGDLVIWNNCGTLHRVIPYDRDSGRNMHRTTVAGVEYIQ